MVIKTKNLIVIIIVILFVLPGCAIQKKYYPIWADDIRNPENAEFVDEVSFNEDIPFCRVTQEQFNKRYEIR